MNKRCIAEKKEMLIININNKCVPFVGFDQT